MSMRASIAEWGRRRRHIARALLVLLCGAGLGYFLYTTHTEDSRFAFRFGLDLEGGSHLVYEADVSGVADGEIDEAMESLRDVIERRVNVFGVSEPLVQVERGSVIAGSAASRLIVELPGVTDVDEAVTAIGKTPLLEFKLVNPASALEDLGVSVSAGGAEGVQIQPKTERYLTTGLTGRFLSRATLQFDQSRGGFGAEPFVQVEFDEAGAALFEEITREHVGEQIAIFLDGESLSEPVVREPIAGGIATISGGFTPQEARDLVRNLNFGALPVPIALASTQSIGATLGEEARAAGVLAGAVGFALLSLFLALWYRVPGLVAVLALALYVMLMLALFKLIPVVLTAAGIAGFILSIGLAVDANILIAERIKEELAAGRATEAAIREGFARAWLAIRDSNITHIIAGVILFWFGTALIKGFALVFALGVVVSMLSAITISRTLLLALSVNAEKPTGRFLLGSGIRF